ncbi:MFS transporter [Sedimentitalea sp. JM2-8]|uniref:MFS transporter n=1 Tax=Sedimentitalea xiamensis TaxID=3050037 RepID=A0ABT7FEZ0_9RHOB|nr:MFS transporter [Sedimentitalea xiamensis]MDK3073663.1 MFS transporter [Sedimentitalea xiamensis]
MQTKYRVVIGGCLIQFTVIGLLFSFGLLIKALEVEYGWSRTLMSACTSVAFLGMGILAMVVGPLSDRLGPRRVLLVSGAAYGAGFVLMSQVGAPWQLFLLFATLIPLGLGSHDVVTLSTVARWFEGRRGMMTAVVKVGTALGQILVPPMAAVLIVALGWRGAVVVLGLAALAVLLAAALMMEHPGAPEGRAARGPGVGADFSQARRSRSFWTLCAVQFLTFVTVMTIPLHLPVYGMDLGMTPPAAAALLSVVGGASILGRLTVGRLLDLIGGRNAFAGCYLALIASLAGFAATEAPGLLYPVVAVYGFAHGGLFVVVSPTVAEYYGMRAHGAIFGAILFFGTLGGSIGPVLAGAIFDATGAYAMAFRALLVLAVLGLVLIFSLPSRQAAAEQPLA